MEKVLTVYPLCSKALTKQNGTLDQVEASLGLLSAKKGFHLLSFVQETFKFITQNSEFCIFVVIRTKENDEKSNNFDE